MDGSNIAIVSGILLGLFTRLFGRRKRVAVSVTIGGIILYTLLVGADAAVTRAALMGIGFIPQTLNRPFANLADLVPSSFYMWWDPKNKADNPVSAPYSYPRYSLKSLAEVLRLGYATEEEVAHKKPASADIIVISNASDDSVSNPIIEEFIALWEAHGADLLTTYEFEKALGLPHDLITPTRPGNRVDLVYPVIHDLLENASVAK